MESKGAFCEGTDKGVASRKLTVPVCSIVLVPTKNVFKKHE